MSGTSSRRRESCGCSIDTVSGLLVDACDRHAADAELLHDARPRAGRGGGQQRSSERPATERAS